jgi:photosystem II stability/assembly factor-like uncharacterized protein
MKKFLASIFTMLMVQYSFCQWIKTDSISGIQVNKLYSSAGELWAATSSGVYKYNSVQWSKLSENINYNVTSILKFNNYLFSGTSSNGVYRSNDNGNNWVQVNNNLTSTVIQDIKLYKNIITVGSSSGFFISDNNGLQWTNRTSNISNSNIKAIVEFKDSLIVGTQNGVFVSKDTAKNWTIRNSGLGSNKEVSSFIVVGTKLFVSIKGGGIYQTENFPFNWIAVNSNLSSFDVNELFFKNDTLFAGTNDSLYFASNISNIQWKVKKINCPSEAVNSLNQYNNNIVVANSFGTFRLGNNNSSDANLGFPKYTVQNVFTVNGLVYIQTSNGIWQYDNSKFTFNSKFPNNSVKGVLNYNDTTILAFNEKGLFKGSISLKSWAQISSKTNITSIAILDTTVFMATSSEGVYRTVDLGKNWLQINIGLTKLGIKQLLTTDKYLIAMSNELFYSNFFISTDKGDQWDAISAPYSLLGLGVLNGKVYCGNGYDAYLYGVINSYDIQTKQWSSLNTGVLLPSIRGSIEGLTATTMIYDFKTLNNTIYATTYSGHIIYSDDFGANWNHISNGLSEFSIYGMLGQLFIANNELFYISKNNTFFKRAKVSNEFASIPINLKVYYKYNSSDVSKVDFSFEWTDNSNNETNYYIGKQTLLNNYNSSYSFIEVLGKTSANISKFALAEQLANDTTSVFYLQMVNGSDISKPILFGKPIKISETNINIGINNKTLTDNNVTVYPNPFSDQLLLNSNSVKIKSVELINGSGQKLFYSNVGVNFINTACLEQGFYYLRIETEDKILIKKVLKLK